MASREKAVQCSGERCKEVFHIYENYEPGGINDYGYIAVKCKKCGAVTQIRMKNPSKDGFFENFEVIDAWEDGERGYNETPITRATALVMGREPSEGVIPDFQPSKEFPLWQDGETNLEVAAFKKFNEVSELLDREMHIVYNPWVKSVPGYNDLKRCLVEQEFDLNGETHTAVWGKGLKNDDSFSSAHFQLIDCKGSDKRIDGVYSRDEMMAYLFRLLIRWKMMANQVVIVTPFIGFDFPFSKEESRKELIELWEMLNSTLDIERTTFITRVKTYGSLKKCQKELDVPADVLKEWDLMNNLQKMVDNPNTRIKTKAQFHAKFYAGVFDDHVELLSGSFNVQTGGVLEQMHLRRISKALFKSNYIDRLVDGFEYAPSFHPRTVYIAIDKNKVTRHGVQ